MTATIMPNGKHRFYNLDGSVLVGGKLYTYAAGTVVPKATFSDQATTIPNTNPIILDVRGEALVRWDGAYKYVLTTAAGVTIETIDDFTPDMSLLSASSASGMIGFLYAAIYAAGSIGKWLQDLGLSAGSSFIGFVQSGADAVARTVQDKLREQPKSLYDFGGAFGGNCIAAMDKALTSGATVILVPDNVTLGQHTISSPNLTIIGGRNVTFSPAVLAGGFRVGTSGRVEITGFIDAVLAPYPETGGVIDNGHVFVSLVPGCVIGELFIRKNSMSGGRIGISAGFESGRTLTGRCVIEENTCSGQNGGLGGEGYGIHYANENDTGVAYLGKNTVVAAGRHSIYIARNKSAAVTLVGNTAINHRENSSTKDVQVRAALMIVRSNNVTGYGNTVNGFYDSALMISEEAEVGVISPLNADNVRLFGTTIRNPKNATAAVWTGYTDPSATATINGLLLEGLTFDSSLNGSQVFQHSWGRGIKVRNLDITYRNLTAGARMLVLQGNTVANSNDITFDGININLYGCTGAFSIIRPIAPFANTPMPLTIRDIRVINNTGAAVITDWEPSVALTNPVIDVFGFSFPTGSVPKQTVFPSLLTTLSGSSAWDPGSVAVGGRALFNVAVNGAMPGDFCIPSFSLSLASMSMTASVEAANVVTVCLTNNSSGAVDIAAGTVKVLLLKRV